MKMIHFIDAGYWAGLGEIVSDNFQVGKNSKSKP